MDELKKSTQGNDLQQKELKFGSTKSILSFVGCQLFFTALILFHSLAKPSYGFLNNMPFLLAIEPIAVFFIWGIWPAMLIALLTAVCSENRTIGGS